MGKVLIIKGADFSSVAVEKIDLFFDVTNNLTSTKARYVYLRDDITETRTWLPLVINNPNDFYIEINYLNNNNSIASFQTYNSNIRSIFESASTDINNPSMPPETMSDYRLYMYSGWIQSTGMISFDADTIGSANYILIPFAYKPQLKGLPSVSEIKSNFVIKGYNISFI